MKSARLLFTLLVAACGAQQKTTEPPPPTGQTETSTQASLESKEPILKIVALSDFHGWLLPLESKEYPRYYGGIANFAGMLEHKEKIDPSSALLLDNGDMWTGPTESTLLRGESVIQAYNALGMAAANVANHEFDFGIEILRARATEAKFPFLGANVVKTGTEDHPDFLKPYTVVERKGFKVGVIGLTYVDTPKTTLAKYVEGLEFKPYEETLRKYVPKMKADGAEIIVVLFHEVIGVVEETIKKVADLGIHAVVAGQDHRKATALVEGVPIVNPGKFGQSYVRFDVRFDPATRAIQGVTQEIVDVTGEVGAPPYPPSPEIVAIVEAARQKAMSLANEKLGRIAKPLPIGSFDHSPLGHFIVDSWLKSLPQAEFAILNLGAMRQPLASGVVTIGNLISTLPFENNLYIVKMTGKDLKRELGNDDPVVGGMTWSFTEKNKTRTVITAVDRVGKPIKDAQTYKVAILDFMYTGGDGYTFKQADTAPEDTGLSWREPIMREFRSAESTNRVLAPQSSARARRVH
jgi:2',3'-cyclic-nucleotide 2'-phosphodiesterase (5'-nucleotidase family)